MGVIAGGAILLLSRGAPARPEDDPDATLAEGAGTVDVFPTQSIWPFAVGLSAAVAASGFAFGAWLVLIGAARSLGRLPRSAGSSKPPRAT